MLTGFSSLFQFNSAVKLTPMHSKFVNKKGQLLKVKASNFNVSLALAVHTLAEENAEAADNGNIFQLVSVFSMVCHTLQSCKRSTPSRDNQGQSLLCVCVCGVWNVSNLACIVLVVKGRSQHLNVRAPDLY
jgi:hypothetical protein